jgi:putative heme-binding domain-containing protein
LIATFVLRSDGAGFRSRNSWNLLASDDEWTAPIMAEVGPDSNVWFIDWYNYIVQHNPTPAGFRTGKGNAYESDLRDKKHGRIYRLVWNDTREGRRAGSAGPATLAQASPDQLLAALQSDNFLWRRHAQRLLIEQRQNDVVEQLVRLAGSSTVDEIGLNVPAIHALWTLQGLGLLDGQHAGALQVALDALRNASAGVRRNALAVLPRNSQTAEPMARLAVEDTDSQVRLAACLACAESDPSPAVAKWLLAALQRSDNVADRWLRDSLVAAAARHDHAFLSALGSWDVSRASDVGSAGAVIRRVAEHYARGTPSTTIGSLLVSLSKAQSAAIVGDVMAGLAAGWRSDQAVQLDEATENAVLEMFQRATTAQRASLVALGSRWGSKKLESYAAEITADFRQRLSNDGDSDADRIAAAQQWIEFRSRDSATATTILELITPRTPPALGQGLIDAIGRSESPDVGQILAERLSALTPQLRATGLRVLLSRAEWTRALIDALNSGKLPLGDLTLDQKLALNNHPNPGIAKRARDLLKRGGELPNPDRQKVVDELLTLTKATGDAASGKAVFLKTCAKCHTHSGEGTRIGPDLTGMAVHPKHELLVHIIDPGRSVEGNYRVYTVLTDDGRVFTGLLASESKTSIELIDAEAKKHTILREDIEQLAASAKSLMPDGVEKQHSSQEVMDLLEFLTRRGKYLPIPLEKYATVVSTKGMFNSESAQVERLIFSDWAPKTVDGIPFVLVDPQGDRTPNVIMLHGDHGTIPPRMPRSVRLTCNAPARAVHFLSGISGWGYPAEPRGGHTLTVRLTYEDGETEDHLLTNGEHFADYIRRVDVPGSKFAFALRGQQVRFLSVLPKREMKIESIELLKGRDRTAPIVMAVTIESP